MVIFNKKIVGKESSLRDFCPNFYEREFQLYNLPSKNCQIFSQTDGGIEKF